MQYIYKEILQVWRTIYELFKGLPQTLEDKAVMRLQLTELTKKEKVTLKVVRMFTKDFILLEKFEDLTNSN